VHAQSFASASQPIISHPALTGAWSRRLSSLRNIRKSTHGVRTQTQYQSVTQSDNQLTTRTCYYKTARNSWLGNATRVPGYPKTRVNPPVFKPVNPFVRGRKPGFDGFNFGCQYTQNAHYTARVLIYLQSIPSPISVFGRSRAGKNLGFLKNRFLVFLGFNVGKSTQKYMKNIPYTVTAI